MNFLPAGWFDKGYVLFYRHIFENLIPEGGHAVEIVSYRGRSICSVEEAIKARNIHVIPLLINFLTIPYTIKQAVSSPSPPCTISFVIKLNISRIICVDLFEPYGDDTDPSPQRSGYLAYRAAAARVQLVLGR